MSPEEQSYALAVSYSRLVPGGLLIIADETEPEGGFSSLAYRMLRLPAVTVTYLLTQATTRPVRGLAKRVRAAGYCAVVEERLAMRNLIIVRGNKGAS